MAYDDQTDDQGNNPELMDYIKQKLSGYGDSLSQKMQAQDANQNQAWNDTIKGLQDNGIAGNSANPTDAQKQYLNGVTGSVAGSMGPVAEEGEAAQGIMPKLRNMLGVGDEATSQDLLNKAASNESGATLSDIGAATDANSRNIDQSNRLQQALAAKRAKAVAYARKGS